MILFTTNPQCTVPIHTFVTDVVETCGGNTRLVRFLNRLGSDLEAEVDDIMYRVFGGECEHARDSEHGESDSCGNISDHGDQSSEEEMDIDSIDA